MVKRIHSCRYCWSLLLATAVDLPYETVIPIVATTVTSWLASIGNRILVGKSIGNLKPYVTISCYYLRASMARSAMFARDAWLSEANAWASTSASTAPASAMLCRAYGARQCRHLAARQAS